MVLPNIVLSVMARKGYSVLGLLKGYGFHSDGLSPLTCGTVYNRMVSPSMLYGCEVWGAIPQAKMRTLEVVQKRVAKHIQGLHRRTCIHDEIVRGMLGWLPMSASIDLCNIKFVFKLLKLPPDNIVKKIFVTQLYIKSLVPGKVSNRSITSDICNVLDKYNMTDMLNEYLSSGTLPSKMFVKQAASASVRSYETESWRRGLTNKGATRFLKVHTTLQPHVVYEIVRYHMDYRRSLINIITLLAFPQECEECMCSECGVAYTDIVKHYVMAVSHYSV